MRKSFVVAISGLAFLWCMGSQAASEQTLGNFKKWTAYAHKQVDKKACTQWTQPIKMQGKYKMRGPVYLFVNYTKGDEVPIVSVDLGYHMKKDSFLTVKIGKAVFQFYTSGQYAFAYKDETLDILAAMKKTSQMHIYGLSLQSIKTDDTYSLIGFQGANNAVVNACQ